MFIAINIYEEKTGGAERGRWRYPALLILDIFADYVLRGSHGENRLNCRAILLHVA